MDLISSGPVVARHHWPYFCAASRREFARLSGEHRRLIESRSLIRLESLVPTLEHLFLAPSARPGAGQSPIGLLIDEMWDLASSDWFACRTDHAMTHSRFAVGSLLVALCRTHEGFGPPSHFPTLMRLGRIARAQSDPRFAEHLAAIVRCASRAE